MDCAGASSHVGACVVGAMYAMARSPDAALVLGNAGVAEKVSVPLSLYALSCHLASDVYVLACPYVA